MFYIDTHTHNSDKSFAGEEDAVIQRCLDAGVKIMLQPDVDSSEREAMFSLCKRYPEVLRPMLGLYPGSVKDDWKEELDKMLEYADQDIVAVGEIGLDYHYGKEFKEQQKEALKWQLEWAANRELPVNIHLREATEDFFAVLDSCNVLPAKGCLHAFSGSVETWRRLQKYGRWSVGIGGIVTFKKASLADTVKEIPLDYIVLETDSPYMAPTPLRGTRNDSSNLPLIAAKIAELKGISLEKTVETTTQNAINLFNL